MEKSYLYKVDHGLPCRDMITPSIISLTISAPFFHNCLTAVLNSHGPFLIIPKPSRGFGYDKKWSMGIKNSSKAVMEKWRGNSQAYDRWSNHISTR